VEGVLQALAEVLGRTPPPPRAAFLEASP
jgi:hypothetical protein